MAQSERYVLGGMTILGQGRAAGALFFLGGRPTGRGVGYKFTVMLRRYIGCTSNVSFSHDLGARRGRPRAFARSSVLDREREPVRARAGATDVSDADGSHSMALSFAGLDSSSR